MPTVEQSIAEIKLLLERFAGVSVTSVLRREARVVFELQLVEAGSILWMEEMAAAANIVGKNMFAWGPPRKGESVAESLGKLRFSYEVRTDNDELSWYGCHLVWNLAGRKILELPEADRLMKLWNGRPRWSDVDA